MRAILSRSSSIRVQSAQSLGKRLSQSAVAALALLLAHCAAAPTTPQQTAIAEETKSAIALPAARKAIVERRTLWKDPDSIKDARIGQPHRCLGPSYQVGFSYGDRKVPASCVCIELNAKNSYGGYTGVRRTVAVFPDAGGFDTMDGGVLGFDEYCQNLQPFPELNGGSNRTSR